MNASRSTSLSTRSSGFSLVELLVVIAIIAILVALLFPALGHCRRLAKQSREAAAGAQLMAAYSVYANDSRGNVLPGYLPSTMVTGSGGAIQVTDDAGLPLTGQLATRYPWRIAPYMDYNFRGLYDDPRVLESYQSSDPANRQYILSVSPSYGVNAEFVGGKATPGFGFNANALRAYGPFYITRMDQVRRADRLLVFASARGVDGTSSGQFAGGIVPGFHMIDAPSKDTPRWSSDTYTEDADPALWGNIHPRHSSKANIAHADGHIALWAVDDLRDMTRWSNQATRPDWLLGQN
jgi:prepilin-type N-terminal cleavage/methylation domain-containing protein/prepilin-type processing-associated H-X9-DG protein